MAATITCELHGDVLVDILARLPVKSLKRFRSVTKYWCSLIQSSEFVSAHYSFHKKLAGPLVNHSVHQCLLEREPDNFTPFHNHGKYCSEKIRFLSLLSDQTLDVVSKFEIPRTSSNPLFMHYTIVQSHCRGIICFLGRTSINLWNPSINLWNPATKEFRITPACPIEGRLCAISFGYNYKRDDYAVVGMYSYFFQIQLPPFWAFGNLQLALYSLATNSWRIFDVNLIDTRISRHTQREQVILNGFYHCWVQTDDRENLVLSFDLSDQVFFTTPFPDEYNGRLCDYELCKHLQFMEINGSVGALFTTQHMSDGYRFYDVWVLGEPGVKNPWAKLYSIGPIPSVDFPPACVYDPLGVNSNGEFFFSIELGTDFRLVKYLPSNKEMKICQVEGDRELQLVMYSESLVSLN